MADRNHARKHARTNECQAAARAHMRADINKRQTRGNPIRAPEKQCEEPAEHASNRALETPSAGVGTAERRGAPSAVGELERPRTATTEGRSGGEPE